MRVAIQKSTGLLIEMQSDATEGTLLQNAVNCGFLASDVEERIVNGAEYAALLAAQPMPTVTAEAARRAAIVADPLCANMLAILKTATAAQISNYVDNNVTDLPSARTMFKRILLAISLDQRDGG